MRGLIFFGGWVLFLLILVPDPNILHGVIGLVLAVWIQLTHSKIESLKQEVQHERDLHRQAAESIAEIRYAQAVEEHESGEIPWRSGLTVKDEEVMP